jgi:hypothetical protein
METNINSFNIFDKNSSEETVSDIKAQRNG